MPTATCAECGARIPIVHVGGNDELWRHADEHRYGNAALTQLPQITFREQALTAIRALAVTGREFTVGDAHEMVTVPPLNPRTDWENARKEAERLGWIVWTGKFCASIVPTSRSSAVKVWQGTAAARTRGVA